MRFAILALVIAISLWTRLEARINEAQKLQETNFEMSVLEFKGSVLTSSANPTQAFFRYKGKEIPLKLTNSDAGQRIVVELPRFPKDVGSHFLDGELVIFGGDVTFSEAQTFPILLVRQP